ncbi:uncharacterized protein LOC144057941 [Vanacampus margaritifer]
MYTKAGGDDVLMPKCFASNTQSHQNVHCGLVLADTLLFYNVQVSRRGKRRRAERSVPRTPRREFLPSLSHRPIDCHHHGGGVEGVLTEARVKRTDGSSLEEYPAYGVQTNEYGARFGIFPLCRPVSEVIGFKLRNRTIV